MPDEIQILSHEELSKLRKTTGDKNARRARWAFHRGGSFDLITLQSGAKIAAVEDPKKLTAEQRAEILAAAAKEQERHAAIAEQAEEKAAANQPAAKPTK